MLNNPPTTYARRESMTCHLRLSGPRGLSGAEPTDAQQLLWARDCRPHRPPNVPRAANTPRQNVASSKKKQRGH